MSHEIVRMDHGRLRGTKISRRPYLSKGFLEISLSLIVIWMNVLTTSYGQEGKQPEGFVSICCGCLANGFPNFNTKLEFFSDVDYIKTGNSSYDLRSPTHFAFRFFPERRNKYCYELPTTANTTYLFRAVFYLDSQTVSLMSLPIQFIVSIDATPMFTMTYDSPDTQYNQTYSQEVIFFSSGKITNVCLQPIKGWAFISTLELRPLDSSMYSYSGSTRQYLMTLMRYNIGADSSSPAVRYPDDSYDRLWYSPGSAWADYYPNVSASTPPDNVQRREANSVPPLVMKDAWGGEPFSVTFLNLFGKTRLPVYFDPPVYAYVVVYTEDLWSNVGSMTVALDSDPSLPVKIEARANMAVNPNFILSANSIDFTLSAQEGQESNVSMNALEVLAQFNFNFSTTLDVAVITALKKSFNLTDWQGDPCIPVPHDWLSCGLSPTPDSQNQGECGGSGPAKGEKCTVEQGFLRSTYSVNFLNLSNLPTSGFSLLQEMLAELDSGLDSLAEMYITESNVDTTNLDFLIDTFANGGGELTYLDLSNNVIDNIGQITSLRKLEFLILPFNFLDDLTVTALDNANFSDSLQVLNLSHNAMTNLPDQWQNPPNSLTILDLSYNEFTGEISTLDKLVEVNDTLQELYVSDNNFTGTMSSLYFSALPNLEIAIFDRNSINGTLNLSAWFEALQEFNSSETDNNNSSTPVTQKLFSFVNNSISNILPSVKHMESKINFLRDSNLDFPNFGILLGGNPYCKGAKSAAQQYLCRSTVSDPITKPDNSTRTIQIIGICSGLFAFLLLSVTTASLWKLWRQVSALREIQQALADQKVQPPFYQYSDIKSATQDFFKDNKLGQGGFGEVYKGVLQDGTSVAVKKLFNSQQLKVLNEFLNEVVLITGIKHKNLVQLKGCCIKDKQRLLIYEYVEKGNLAQALWGSKAHGGLNWNQRFIICIGVARGLSYLHEELQPSIIHRDIKPENILLDKNFQPKIADFGLARNFSDESEQTLYTKVAGTLGYFSPEYATQGQLSDKVDVYSYGIVVLEIISGRKCIDYSLPPEEVYLKDWVHRMHKKGMLLDTLQPELRDNCIVHEVIRAVSIGLLCVQNDPEMRPSMSQVVTMFLGSMDVSVPAEDSQMTRSRFKELVVTTDDEVEYPALPTVMEEGSVDFPLIDFSFESSSSRTSSKRVIQMRSFPGR